MGGRVLPLLVVVALLASARTASGECEAVRAYAASVGWLQTGQPMGSARAQSEARIPLWYSALTSVVASAAAVEASAARSVVPARLDRGSAVAGQFLDLWLQTSGGFTTGAPSLSVTPPPRFEEALARLQREHAPLMPRVDHGQVMAQVPALRMARIRRETKHGSLAPARTLVLCCGGGGASVAFQGFSGAVVAAAVDVWGAALEVYAANFDHPVLRLDLSQVDRAVLALRALGPFDMAQVSAPCTDFSSSGKRVEGQAAQLTVTCTQIVMRLGIPCVIYENVPRVLSSHAWAAAEQVLEEHGFSWAGAILDAQHCGVPQRRRRSFVLALQGQDTERRAQVLNFAAALEGVAATPVRPHRSVADVVPDVGATVFLHARNGRDACVLASSEVAPTLRTNCAYRPSEVWRGGVRCRRYTRRESDCPLEAIDDTTFLSGWQLGMIGGFPEGFRWPADRRLVGTLVGNSVAPAALRCVLELAQEVGALSLRAPLGRQPSPAELEATSLAAAGRWRVTTSQSFDRDSWARAAASLRQAAMAPDRRRRARPPEPPWFLDPPRSAQSPRTRAFREGCEARGIPTLGPEQERLYGLGDRDAVPDLSGDRALVQEGSRFLQTAAERIAAARRGDVGPDGKPVVTRSGLLFAVTGSPARHVAEFRNSGAGRAVLRWLSEGFKFEFNDKPPPIALGGLDDDGNHPGASDPCYARWLYEVWAELILFGVVSESAFRPFIVCPLGIVPKADYDAVLKPHRLRLLLDQRSLNVYLDPPRFRNESLHGARHMFRKGQALLSWDFSSFFWQLHAAAEDREMMGCRLGGRFWVWHACPMGVSTSPHVAQTVAWVVAKALRARGIRVLSYCDDWLVTCADEDVADVVAFVEATFARHGLIIAPKKSVIDGRHVVTCLGTEVDLDAFVFRVPEEKKKRIVRDLRVLLALAERGDEIPIRLLAESVGRIMATHTAVGDVARRETRASYAFIAALTGVPPDATRRELRVAWDRKGIMPAEVAEELRLWRDLLPGHTGTSIREEPDSPCSVRMASDASDTHWAGFVEHDDGQWRALARERFSPEECVASSTEREVLGAARTLEALIPVLEKRLAAAGQSGIAGRRVLFFSDSQSAVRALTVGSKRPRLHRAARRIFRLAMQHSFVLVPRWARRSVDFMQFCDTGSKLPDDDCDFALARHIFLDIQSKWHVRHSVDCFASRANRRCEKFFSRFSCRGTAAVDAFSEHWGRAPEGGSRPDCWLHPPRALVLQTIRHLQACGGRGTIVVPFDRRCVWWPLVLQRAPWVVRRDGKALWRRVRRGRGVLCRGGGFDADGGAGARPLMDGRPLAPGHCDLLVIRLDFAGFEAATLRPDCSIAAARVP